MSVATATTTAATIRTRRTVRLVSKRVSSGARTVDASARNCVATVQTTAAIIQTKRTATPVLFINFFAVTNDASTRVGVATAKTTVAITRTKTVGTTTATRTDFDAPTG